MTKVIILFEQSVQNVILSAFKWNLQFKDSKEILKMGSNFSQADPSVEIPELVHKWV
jgi:hypothetical protein